MNVVNRNFSLDHPLPPAPVLISRSPSMKSPFLSFLVIHTGYWSVLFSSDEADIYKSSYYFIMVNFHGKVDMKPGESKTFLRYIYYEKSDQFPQKSGLKTGVDPMPELCMYCPGWSIQQDYKGSFDSLLSMLALNIINDQRVSKLS